MLRRSIVAALMYFVAGAVVFADDRALLQGWGAAPNIVLVLDSGSSMSHDAAASALVFVANADEDGSSADFHEGWYGAGYLEALLGEWYREALENGAKLAQAKSALLTLLDESPGVNFAFTSFAREGLEVAYLNFVYRVADGQGPMLDGHVSGDLLRLGAARDHSGAESPIAAMPIRFGGDGCSVFVENSDPFGGNLGSEEDPAPGDIRLVAFLVDGADPADARRWSELDLENRESERLFYHPAFDVDAVDPSTHILDGLTGSMPWDEVAPFLGVDTSNPDWRSMLREAVFAELQPYSIGSEVLRVLERYELFAADSGWRAATPSDCPSCDPSHVSTIEFVQDFVLHDHDPSQEGVGITTLSAVSFAPASDCDGYVCVEPGSRPLVELSEPDPMTGVTGDQRQRIRAYLGPQSNALVYVPAHAESTFLPAHRDHALPDGRSVVAAGRRSLAAALEQAAEYFSDVVGEWTDPLNECRDKLVIIVTDGGDSCVAGGSACDRVAGLEDVPVHLVVFGDEAAHDAQEVADLRCIAETTGGSVRFVGPGEATAALRSITRAVEEGQRGFGAMLLPSVRGDSDQMSYVSSFSPVRGRSIWNGSLLAVPVDPLTGLPVVSTGGRIEERFAVWNAGEALARRWDWGDVLAANPFGVSADPRSIYFAAGESGSRRRAPFAFPGNGPERFASRRDLGSRLFGSWPSSFDGETAERQFELRLTVDFIRGVWKTPDAGGAAYEVRSADLYGLRDGGSSVISGIDKLGDIFHSSPERMAAPACLPCMIFDLHGYRQYYEKHRHRRAVIFAGANDGMMHAFDGGLWDSDGFDGGPPRYDAGTGRELFAWVPDAVMGQLPHLAREPVHRWTVDGSATVADVWVVPGVEGAPSGGEREWRTVLTWGLGDGGRSYVCLDVTEPDTYVDGVPSVDGNVSYREQARYDGDGEVASTWMAPAVPETDGSRDAECAGGTTGECFVPWPAFRWEFEDTRDEDGDGGADLGMTWSRPVVTFVRVANGDLSEDRMVSFFGGGLSPAGLRDAARDPAGSFVYGVDVGTGAILFKKAVSGMVAADIQVVDADTDGFAEKLYVATTSGKIYRVNLDATGSLDAATGRVTSWNPQLIFAAEGDQPFFMRPTLVPAFYDAAGVMRLAILIGSGNRDDLLEHNRRPHRFYAFLEPAAGALTDVDLVGLRPDSENVEGVLLGGDAGSGWYLELTRDAPDDWEKVVTPAVAFNHMVTFSTFNPSPGAGDECRNSGAVRSYTLEMANGNPLPERTRETDFSPTTGFVGFPSPALSGDGQVHVAQITDTLEVSEAIEPVMPLADVVDWKEE